MHAFAPTGRLASMADDTNYGSLGALAPNWDEGERNIDTDEIYERFFTWVEDVKGVEPWPHQEEAIMDLLAGDHVILNTPTGSGKSLVALGMHFAALCTGRRSYYTAPIKALVSEKFFDLVEVFGRENVGMITGDTHINADAPIICCTAEILANQALREGRHADVGCGRVPLLRRSRARLGLAGAAAYAAGYAVPVDERDAGQCRCDRRQA